MPNYKSRSDEFSDLEARLRQNRPQNEPLSPAFKRQLRAHLLEQKRMNIQKSSFGQLAAAVVGLVIIIGIPLYFWSIQMSLSGGSASQPDGVSAIDPTAAPTETAVAESVPPEATASHPVSVIPATPLASEEAGDEAETAVEITEPVAQAAIAEIGVPEPVTDHPSGAPSATFFNIPVTIDYTLQGYEEAVLVIAYELTEANGTAGGSQMLPITPTDADSVTFDLTLSNSYVDDVAALRPEVDFAVHINVYDTEAEQYVNLYPGDVELLEHEQNPPYPFPKTDDFLALDAITLTNVSEDDLSIVLTLLANVDSQPEGTVTAVVSSEDVTLASDSVIVSAEEPVVTLPLTLTGVTDDTLLNIAVTLVVGEEERVTSVVFAPADLSAPASNSVWIVDAAAEPGPGDVLTFTFVVGYQLEAPYTGGVINHSASFTASGGNGGGGGGGGGGANGRTLPVGTGLTTIRFSFGDSDLTVDNWADLLSAQITLLGITAEGNEELVDIVTLPETE